MELASKLSDFERGFLVGLIEGEGSLLVRGRYKLPVLSISNTDLDLLEYANELLAKVQAEGTIRKQGRKKSQGKQCYGLNLSRWKCIRNLLPVLDFLISKHRKQQLGTLKTALNALQDREAERMRRLNFIIKEIQTGKTVPEVAVPLGTSKNYLYLYLRLHGYRVRSLRNGGIVDLSLVESMKRYQRAKMLKWKASRILGPSL